MIYLRTIFSLQNAFVDLMTPWSIDCVLPVVLGGRKTRLTDLRLVMKLWAAQLSTMSTTFLPSRSNFWCCSWIRSSKSILSIQLFLRDLYLHGKFQIPEKQRGLCDFPIANMGTFSPTALPDGVPVNGALLCFPPTHFSDFKCSDWSGNPL